LIEPVEESNHHSVTEVLARSLAPQYSEAHIFFL
jgi:hypothetical protein